VVWGMHQYGVSPTPLFSLILMVFCWAVPCGVIEEVVGGGVVCHGVFSDPLLVISVPWAVT